LKKNSLFITFYDATPTPSGRKGWAKARNERNLDGWHESNYVSCPRGENENKVK